MFGVAKPYELEEKMDFMNLIKDTRTVRRFKEKPITRETLEMLVDCARYSPCGANKQVLKFMLINDRETNEKVFPTIKWAGALDYWDGPEKGERPSAYIIILLDKELSNASGVDHGIAAQSMMLGARSAGLGCCMIGAYDKPALIDALNLPEQVSPQLILALGEPGEEIIVDDYIPGESIAYYRDDQDRHHVPKRGREELIWK
jgi:nitroreductase